MAKFLITGAKGQVGFCLTQQLMGKVEMLALDSHELDITNRELVFNTIREFRPDIIINAAAYTAVDKAETEIDCAEAINIKGPKYLAEAANEIDAIILHISTDYVFEGTGSGEYYEHQLPNPQSVYGRTKLAGEIAVQQANPKHIILRTAWVFGEHGNNFVKVMLHLAKIRNSLGVVDDQFGGPTYAGDIASTLIEIANQLLAGKQGAFGIYHFTGKPYVSWCDFARSIFNEAELQGVLKNKPMVNCITTADYPTLAKRPQNSRLNLEKIEYTFSIKPSDWQRALKDIKAYI